MQAARDVGIRPLLAQFEDFLNASILPLFDETLAKAAVIKLVGLDAETAEKESVRLQQDMPVHMTFDEVLEKVEKKAIGKRFGGEYPLNPQIQAVHDKTMTMGQILEEFFGIEGATKDPQWAYVRDPFWFQWQQLQMQMQQMQQAQAQAQAQAQQQQQLGAPPEDGGGAQDGQEQAQAPPGADSGGSPNPTPTEKQKSAAAEESSAGGDLSVAANQALGALSKAERQLPPSKRKLLRQQQLLVHDFLKGWEADAKEAHKSILDLAETLNPKPKRKS
jgi:hypothetical protein